MAIKPFIFLLSFLTLYVVSDSCVTYNFEENFDDLFSSYGTCQNIQAPTWTIGEYTDLGLASPDERSTKFIKPSVPGQVNCVSSFFFTMHSGGTFEFNIFVEPAGNQDHIQIMAFQDRPDSFPAIVGLFYGNSHFGWHIARFSVVGPNSYRGFISVLAVASPNATILVDSFRYLPPDSCQIYE